VYWEGHEDLIDKLIAQIVADIQSDTGANPEDGPLYAFWKRCAAGATSYECGSAAAA